MIGLFTKIKAALVGLAGLVAVALYVMLGQRTRQRDAQRQRADRARGDHQASETRREDERRIDQARAQARDHNEQAGQERNDTPKDMRRTGRLGGADRVRDYDAPD